MAKMKIEAIIAIRHDGKRFAPGSVFVVDAKLARKLIDKKQAREAASSAELTEGVIPESARQLLPPAATKKAPGVEGDEPPSQRSQRGENAGKGGKNSDSGKIPGLLDD